MCDCDDWKEFDNELGGIVCGYGTKDGDAYRMLLRDVINFPFCPFCQRKIKNA